MKTNKLQTSKLGVFQQNHKSQPLPSVSNVKINYYNNTLNKLNSKIPSQTFLYFNVKDKKSKTTEKTNTTKWTKRTTVTIINKLIKKQIILIFRTETETRPQSRIRWPSLRGWLTCSSSTRPAKSLPTDPWPSTEPSFIRPTEKRTTWKMGGPSETAPRIQVWIKLYKSQRPIMIGKPLIFIKGQAGRQAGGQAGGHEQGRVAQLVKL